MVVDDLGVPRRAGVPDEADAPSVVDTNAVLAPAIAPQSLQSIAGRRAQVVEPAGRIKHQKLQPRALLDRRRQAANGMACENGSGMLVGEAPDHGPNVTNVDTFSQAVELGLGAAHPGRRRGRRAPPARAGSRRSAKITGPFRPDADPISLNPPAHRVRRGRIDVSSGHVVDENELDGFDATLTFDQLTIPDVNGEAVITGFREGSSITLEDVAASELSDFSFVA